MNRIALIDSDYIVYLVCHNKKDSDHIKTLDECKQRVDECIKSIMLSTKATHYICALTIGKNFRYVIYPEYKANRKSLEKPLYFGDIKQYILEKYKAVWNGNLEADDIVNIIKNNNDCLTLDGLSFDEYFIVSPDKDILMLEGTHYNPNKEKWIETSKNQADLYFWTSMITGDSSDGIKGILGKGIKYAEKLFSNPDILIDNNYSQVVLQEYINYFGEELGIEEFYKNYKCLKIVKSWEGFTIPEPNEFKTSNLIDEFKE